MTLRAPWAQGGCAAAGLAAAAVFVFSATPSAAAFDFRASFDALDADHDGVIALDEYAGAGSHSTLAVELDPSSGVQLPPPPASDGAPSPGRSMTRVAVMMDIDFAATDLDGDGAVDFSEFVTRHEALFAEEFARHDADADGRLSPDELLRDPDTPAAAPAPFPQLFGVFDRDGDGAVTLEEFQAGPG